MGPGHSKTLYGLIKVRRSSELHRPPPLACSAAPARPPGYDLRRCPGCPPRSSRCWTAWPRAASSTMTRWWRAGPLPRASSSSRRLSRRLVAW